MFLTWKSLPTVVNEKNAKLKVGDQIVKFEIKIGIMFTCWKKDVYMTSNCIEGDTKEVWRAVEPKTNLISCWHLQSKHGWCWL